MLKPIDAEAVRRPQQEVPLEAVNTVFKVFHGFYGNLFLSKFSTGQQGDDGKDKGIKSARQVWAFGLRGYDAGTIQTALERCQQAHPEFPPSLPQFVALCAASKPREAYTPPAAPPALTMSPELREKQIAEHRQRARELIEEAKAKDDAGLSPLKRAIADAVACASGDEVATLLRLDVMLAPRASA